LSFKEGYRDWISLAGLLISIILLIIFLYVGSKSTFELTSFARFSSDFAKTAPEVDISTAKYLWSNRTLDVIIQAILVFGAAACCITMLRPEKKGKQA
jgi:hypothetical protein